jgi:hypothetical protein
MDQGFRSVGCAFYEELELLAMRHSSCDIVFLAPGGARSVIRDEIKDLLVREGVEYMKTKGGLEIELTGILEINGKKPSGTC